MSNQFPEGWKKMKLGHLSKISDGAHKTPTYIESGIPFLRVTDIRNSKIDLLSVKFIPEHEHYELVKRCNPKEGDILLSKNGTIGLVKIVDWDWEFSIFVSLALISPKSNFTDTTYLSKVLSSPYLEEQIQNRKKTGTVTNLHLEEIREFDIPLPPIPEQKKIASILTSVDDVIEKTEAQISKLLDLKKGMMTELLTKGIGHTKFKDTPVGKIPAEWEVVRLENIGRWKGGGTPSKSNNEYWTNGTMPWVSPKDMKFKWISTAEEYITLQAIQESSTNIVPSGSILLVVRSGILRHTLPVARTIKDVAINQDMKSLEVSSEFDTGFVFHWFEKESSYILNTCAKVGTTVESLEWTFLKDVLVTFPKIEEQEKISQYLTSVDNRIEVRRQKLSQTKSLKKALMNDLLTGKTRVNINN